MIQLGCF